MSETLSNVNYSLLQTPVATLDVARVNSDEGNPEVFFSSCTKNRRQLRKNRDHPKGFLSFFVPISFFFSIGRKIMMDIDK